MELHTCTPADRPARMNEIQWQSMWRHYILPGHIKARDESFGAGAAGWDLDCCVIGQLDGEDAGFCWGPWQGEEAGCAGFGIRPEFRGRGLGGAMLHGVADRLRAKGVQVWRLEVVQQNPGAIRSYLRAGFAQVRDLGLFRGRVEAPLAAGEEVVESDGKTCLDRYAEWPQVRRTWGASPRQLRAAQEHLQAKELRRGGQAVAFMLHHGSGVTDIGLAPGEPGSSGMKLLGTLPSFGWGNLPDDDPVRAELDACPTAECWVKQWEMEWVL
ncbi:MAG: GNAT family N-acetyltransferase [Armatimonadetes bacterium]|nr:GNAT family N-acetyltransferase [Armatimonadota bacterium]